MDIENSDSSVKNSFKLMEKLKIELKNNDLDLFDKKTQHQFELAKWLVER